LNAILGFGRILDSNTLPKSAGQQKEFVNHILKAGRHLLTLINEILDLAKIESGGVTLSLEPMPISELLLECQQLTEPLASQRGVRMIFPSQNVNLPDMRSDSLLWRERGAAEIPLHISSTHFRLLRRLNVADKCVGLTHRSVSQQLFWSFACRSTAG